MNKPLDLRSVAERLDQHAASDISVLHKRIQNGMGALAKKVHGAIPLKADAAAEPYHSFSSPDGGMGGTIRAYRGAPLDWAIDSFLASPKFGFCNHHLTLWLDSSVATPHLAMAVGVIPQLFFFCDLVPRSDLWVNTRELDRYHAVFNKRTLAVAADPRFRPFVSQEPYIRQAISPIGLCLEGEATAENVDHVLGLAEETLDVWLRWLADPEHTPEAQRAALAQRDDQVRRTICWRDPANIVAERVLGKAVTDDLVRLLSAEARRV